MKLALQSQKFRPLKLILSIGLVMLAFHSENTGHAASSGNSQKPLTKTIPTDKQFEANPTGMCGRACENVISCQKDAKLAEKCQQFCSKSRCVTKGKKSAEGTTTSTPGKSSQAQKPAANASSSK